MLYQSASVAQADRPAGRRPAEHVVRASVAVPTGARRTRGPLAGERWRLVAVDLAILAAASSVAGSAWMATAVRAALSATAFLLVGLYRPRLQFSALDDLTLALLGVAVAVTAGAWLSPATLPTPPALSRLPLAWPAVVVACVVLGRALAYAVLRRRRRRMPGERTIILGSGDVAIQLAGALRADRGYGLVPIGLVGPPPLTGESLPAPLLGSGDDVDAVLGWYRPRNVIVAFSGPPDADLVGTLRQWRRRGIRVYVVPRLYELPLGRSGAELVHGIPLIRMRPDPPRRWRRATKRAVDIVGATIGLVLLAPLFAACALAVRIECRGAGVLFRQERIGRDGKPITVLKFRSLTPSSEAESQVRWNIDGDARVGPVGRVLRLTSLDELPQLLNVLRGDMSLVGPRPERPYFVEQFHRTYRGYLDRHRLPVGITGWAQIHGLRGDTSIEDRVRYDNYYIENWSLGLDLKIIIRTVGSMLSVHRK